VPSQEGAYGNNYVSNIGVMYGILCINTYDCRDSVSSINAHDIHIWCISVYQRYVAQLICKNGCLLLSNGDSVVSDCTVALKLVSGLTRLKLLKEALDDDVKGDNVVLVAAVVCVIVALLLKYA